MGRRKIQIKPIKEDRNRYVTFIKRKAGLFKKAHELAVLCQVDLALVVVTPEGKVFEYSTSPNAAEVFKKRQSLPLVEQKRPTDYGFDSRGAGSAGEDDDYEDDDDLSEHDKPHADARGEGASPSVSTAAASHTSTRDSASHMHIQQQLQQPQQSQSQPQLQQQLAHHITNPRSSPSSIIDRPTSRPKLKVQIPISAAEVPAKPGPGPLTALETPTESVAESLQQIDPRQRAIRGGTIDNQSTRSSKQEAGSIGTDQTPSSSSTQHSRSVSQQSLAAMAQQQPTPSHISPGSVASTAPMGRIPPDMTGRGPAAFMHGSMPHQGQPGMQQPFLPTHLQFAAQRGVPVSPSSAPHQGFQIPVGHQGFYGQGMPMGYNYAPAPAGSGAGAGPNYVPSMPSAGTGSGVNNRTGGGPPGRGPSSTGNNGDPQAQQVPGGNMAPGSASAGGSASGNGRWSGFPQSPMTFFVPATGDQKNEPGPVSAAIPSRYMNEMLSPSNYFSMEWGVWDPQASAVPGGTSRVMPPMSAHPSSESKNQDSTPSPEKLDDQESQASKGDSSDYSIENKRRKT